MITPRFSVVNTDALPIKTAGTFTLVIDKWDDYHFKTSYVLHYGTGAGSTEIGAVKIAPRGMVAYDPHTELQQTFTQLGEHFYSLGQAREYYESLAKLPNGVGRAALHALRDVAATPSILHQVHNEEAFSISLLRDLPLPTVTTQFPRIIEGLPPLTPYKFSFSRTHPTSTAPPLRLVFGVRPGLMPPTNVHVLIGSNGVGKSQLLRAFAAAAEGAGEASDFFLDETVTSLAAPMKVPFANAIHVTFSAFDHQDTKVPVSTGRGVEVHRVGLFDRDSTPLDEQFCQGLRVCARGHRKDRWVAAIDRLSGSDPILAETMIRDVISLDEESRTDRALKIFAAMSSGHKIVVLTVTRLIQYVEERSLVLIDEPETHLHPPLLSALTRAISDLVIDRNGVAIVATHSPVVLQEVPRSCAWMLQRSGNDLRAFQLPTETFGESVSRLTSEVFRLDVNRTGYNQVLREMLKQHNSSVEGVIDALGGQLGAKDDSC